MASFEVGEEGVREKMTLYVFPGNEYSASVDPESLQILVSLIFGVAFVFALFKTQFLLPFLRHILD